ncbi:hypothetical protein N7472_004940 [Penicillium cf. griseofulvum]|uniref:Uncharacterized protein n=1 Tax=Penicillium cf. griseofulvum TaxID=2972120 RepID=A0A9W9ME29_9EURO|nr:hypothetical protein N7472_004940 [Penicillium cf. griseofulvum]KAJ5442510.1 hypothetical protein N7445_005517 [Penicillium cf. griseofulvum]
MKRMITSALPNFEQTITFSHQVSLENGYTIFNIEISREVPGCLVWHNEAGAGLGAPKRLPRTMHILRMITTLYSYTP